MFRIDADHEMAIMNFQILIFHQFLSIIVLYIYMTYVHMCMHVYMYFVQSYVCILSMEKCQLGIRTTNVGLSMLLTFP